MKVGVIKCVQRSVQTVAFSEFIEDDVKKLFGCFIMCGYPIKTASLEVKRPEIKMNMMGLTLQLNLNSFYVTH